MPRRMPRPLMRWRTDPCDIFGDSNVFGLVVSMFQVGREGPPINNVDMLFI